MIQTPGNYNIFGQPLTAEARKYNHVFISHRQFDKPVAREVARYFEFLGLHYYLDEDDEVLQQVLAQGHSSDRALVESIDVGLAHSTHLLAILSDRTMGSWWVPYEVGSARAQRYDIAHLLLPSICPTMVPEYLRIYDQLWTPENLFDWAKRLVRWPDAVVLRFYHEWWENEGGGPFGDLGPGDDAFDEWYAQAEHQNKIFMARLLKQFSHDWSCA